jgi:hypothetical protein
MMNVIKNASAADISLKIAWGTAIAVLAPKS